MKNELSYRKNEIKKTKFLKKDSKNNISYRTLNIVERRDIGAEITIGVVFKLDLIENSVPGKMIHDVLLN